MKTASSVLLAEILIATFLAMGAFQKVFAAEQPPEHYTGLDARPDDQKPSAAKTAGDEKHFQPKQVTRLLSPDGTHVAFGHDDFGNGARRTRLFISRLSDRTTMEVAANVVNFEEIVWLDKNRIAYSNIASPHWTIVSNTGEPLGTLKLPASCDVLYKRLSPSGRVVAYVGDLVGRRFYGLFVVDLESGNVRQLLDKAVKTAPAWSPDSRYVAIGTGEGYVKRYPLMLIDVKNGQKTDVGCDGVGAAWSPDGRYLAFSTAIVRGENYYLYGIPIDGRIGVWDLHSRKLTYVSPPGRNIRGPAWEVAGSIAPVWSSDSQWIAYTRICSVQRIRGKQERSETWIVKSDGSRARKILDQSADVAWLPDSRSFLWSDSGKLRRVDITDVEKTRSEK